MKKNYFYKKLPQTKLSFKAILYCLMLIASNVSNATTYYIDSVAGLDSQNGTTINTPWKSLIKINNLTFKADDKILLKSGSVWNGQQLKFFGSGIANFPIIINQYGTGAKPIINGSGSTKINGITTVDQGVVFLYNQDYIEINNLEITNYPITTASTANPNDIFFVGVSGMNNAGAVVNNNPLGADRRGVMIALKDKISSTNTANSVCNHIYLKNLYIHHIKGQLGNGSDVVNGAIPKRTGGIYFTVLNESGTSNSRFNDILIDGCEIGYAENIGLAFDNEDDVFYPGGNELARWTARKYTNIKISNNTIHHIGKNAMIIRCTDETGLIERNVCYETAVGTTGNTMFTARAKGTVFQYNEGYFNRAATQNVDSGNIDGCMYDPDFGSVSIIFQYSYSHDNSHGIYWGCNTRSANNNTTGIPDPEDVGCTLRYCISQNDLGALVYFNYASAGNEIYNNIFYIKSGLDPTIIKENSGNNHTYNFFNNIIYNLSSANSGAKYSFGTTGQIRNIKNNIFYGSQPSGEPLDSAKLRSNPLFVNPGMGTIGLNAALDGYKLQQNSPAIGSGRLVSSNGGLDFYGNVVSATSVPNRGVYAGQGVLGNDSWSNNEISIYPNPIENNQFQISLKGFLDAKVEIEIVNMLGQSVYKKAGGFNESIIMVNPDVILVKGLYLVTVKSENKSKTYKVILK